MQDNSNNLLQTEMQKVIKPKLPRSSNLELYRIIVMLSIVAHHYVVNSGIISAMNLDVFNFRSAFAAVFGMWGKVGINCFVLITGYFMCKSQITIQKFLKLLFEVIFYKFCIGFIFLLAGYTTSILQFFKHLLPVSSIATNFTGCFIVFFLLIPVLNVVVRNFSKKQHEYLLIVSLSAYTVFGTFIGNVEFNYVTWFTILYFIASYIRIHSPFANLTTNNWKCVTLASVLFSVLTVLVLQFLSYRYASGLHWMYRLVNDSHKIMAIFVAVSSFMWFKSVKLEYSKFINTVGASTFGVLLIHANSEAMRGWLWGETLQNEVMYYSPYFVLHAVLSVCGVFVVCIIIDYLRIRYIEAPVFGWLNVRYEKKFARINEFFSI